MAKGDLVDNRVGSAQNQQASSGGGVPDACGLINTCGYNQPAVRAEPRIAYLTGMTLSLVTGLPL
jgi:hypothetical protein